MKSRSECSSYAIVAVAIIWAAVIVAATILMRGSPEFPKLLTILGGGAAATLVILGGTRARA